MPKKKPTLVIRFSLPLKTTNPLNGSQGFSRGAAMGAAKTRKRQRSAMQMAVWAYMKSAGVRSPPAMLPCRITVRRVAPSAGLDRDGLLASCKSVVDGITDGLCLTNDRSPDLEWVHEQRRGLPREYAVEVTIECYGSCQSN